jgi:hypothetical protein
MQMDETRARRLGTVLLCSRCQLLLRSAELELMTWKWKAPGATRPTVGLVERYAKQNSWWLRDGRGQCRSRGEGARDGGETGESLSMDWMMDVGAITSPAQGRGGRQQRGRLIGSGDGQSRVLLQSTRDSETRYGDGLKRESLGRTGEGAD